MWKILGWLGGTALGAGVSVMTDAGQTAHDPAVFGVFLLTIGTSMAGVILGAIADGVEE